MDQVKIVNLVPKFLRFYEIANKPGVSEDRRWEIWNEEVNFAAVPPGEEGQGMARGLLDHAWENA